MSKYLFDDIKRVRELIADVHRNTLTNGQAGFSIEVQKLHNYLITLDIETVKIILYFIMVGINEINLSNPLTKNSNSGIYQTSGLDNINTLKNSNPDALEKAIKLDISEIEKYSISINNYFEKGIESFGNNLIDIILNWK